MMVYAMLSWQESTAASKNAKARQLAIRTDSKCTTNQAQT